MASNLLCEECEKIMFIDFEKKELTEGTYCRLKKEENPNCEKCLKGNNGTLKISNYELDTFIKKNKRK